MWLSRAQLEAEPQAIPGQVQREVSVPRRAQRRPAPAAGWPWADALGLGWVVMAVVAYLSPALWDGFSFGPTDIANQLSYLTYVPHLAVHNGLNGDIITQAVPWNTLDWVAVHHGQLPLWNNYAGDGMPLFFNFESAPLALPTLVGYVFPLGSSFLVGVAVSLLVAGTGTYTATRLAGAGPIGAALAGTTFMLSGSLSGWAGWAVSGPLTWAGWLLAGALLCRQPGRRRWAGVVLTAISCAFAVYEGMPESLLFVAVAIATVVLVWAAVGLARGHFDLKGHLCLLAGVAGGAALSAPLWLPGLAVLKQSSRATENGTGGLPIHALALLLAQGYDGLPTRGSTWFGPADYYEATAYIGVVAVVLALLAVLVAWRRPLVVALSATVLVSMAIIYMPAAQRSFTRLGAGSVATQRMLPMLAFALAILAGLGADILARNWREQRTQSKALACIMACGAGLAFMLVSASGKGLSPSELSARRHSLLWPALTLVGMAVLFAFAPRRVTDGPGSSSLLAGPNGPEPEQSTEPLIGTGSVPRGRGRTPVATTVLWAGVTCLLLLGAQTAYLVWAGIGVNSYAARPFPVSAGVGKLERLVGNNLLALDGANKHDVTLWSGVGLYPEVNAGYGIRELAVHDPVIPPAYFQTWPSRSSVVNAGLGNNFFAPAVGSATRARYYGASFILAAPGSVPKQTQFVAKIPVPLAGSLSLYRVPGAAQFTFGAGSSARVLSARQTGNSTWRVAVDVPTASALTLHLTYFPGWHVSADGKALPVYETGPFVGSTVPAGTRTVTVSYWPGGLTAGFALALTAISALLIGSLLVIVLSARPRSIFSLTTRDEPPGGMLTP
jgi:hypothetical protein